MVLLPACLFGNHIKFLFEKQHSTWASGNECLTLEENHLSQIKLCHPLEPVIFQTLRTFLWIIEYREGLSLAVEDVNLSFVSIIETLLWKVLRRAFYFILLDVSHNLFLLCVIDEMVVHEELVVEYIDENGCVGDEAASHTWIREVSVAHGVIV